MSDLFLTKYPYCYVSLAKTAAPHMRKDVLVNYVKAFIRKNEPQIELVDIKGTYALCKRT